MKVAATDFTMETDDLVTAFSTLSLLENMVKVFDRGLRVIRIEFTTLFTLVMTEYSQSFAMELPNFGCKI